MPLTMMLATLLWGPSWGVRALAMGMLMGTCLQLALMFWLARQLRLPCRPTLRLRVRGMRLVLGSMVPLGTAVIVVQMSPIVDQIVASWLPVGTLSAINYSLKIVDIPVVILFMSASRILLPHFAGQVSTGNLTGLKRSLRASVWIMGLCSLLVSLVFVGFSTQIVQLMFQRGAFTEEAVRMTAGALVGFSVGFVPMGIGFIIPRVYNAIGRNAVLAKMAFVSLVTNFVLDVVLSRNLLHVGIALATSMTYAVATSALLLLLPRYIGPIVYVPGLSTVRQALGWTGSPTRRGGR